MRVVRRAVAVLLLGAAIAVVMPGAAQAAGQPTITTTSLPDAKVGVDYGKGVTVTGGTKPFTFSLTSGTLPSGLSLAPATGRITGTPTTAAVAPSQFTLHLVDATGLTDDQALSIKVNPTPPKITTAASLPTATVGRAYSVVLSGSGGFAPYKWSATGVPAGLTLTQAGLLSGTPTTSGTYSIPVTLTDSNPPGTQVSKSLTLKVLPAPLTISTTSLPAGARNAAYSKQLQATGGVAPYSWAVSAGSLPAGLTLNPNTGVISGTPTGQGTFTFTAKVTDSAATPKSATKQFQLTITGPLTLRSTLNEGVKGKQYTDTVASGGTTPYDLAITDGDLPGGLTFAGGTGVVSGTPNEIGTFTFTVAGSDSSVPAQTASREVTLVIKPKLIIETDAVGLGIVGQPYAEALSAQGGTTPYAWSLAPDSSALPAGLSLSSTGLLSGTPTTAGTTSVTVRVTDASAPSQVDTQVLQIKIVNPLAISTTSLPGGIEGKPYSKTLVAAGGLAPYVWDIESGTLPTGLSLAGATGVISGTPEDTGSWTFDVSVEDASGQLKRKTFTIVVAEELFIDTTNLDSGLVGVAYSQGIDAFGGTAPYKWTLKSGTLPAGLALSDGGVISGTPTTVGSSTFTLTVTDAGSPPQTKDRTFTINIVKQLAISSTSPLTRAVVGAPYSRTLTATGGDGNYEWELLSGALPEGLTLGEDGKITGTPTTAGNSEFDVRVVDGSAQEATKTFTLKVVTALHFPAQTLAPAFLNKPYSDAIVAEDGTGPYTFSLLSGSLPTGLSLGSDGVLTGTPTVLGTKTFTVKVTDASNPSQSASATFSLTVTKLLAISTTSLPSGVEENLYNATLAATGGTAGYTWEVISGDLPEGLSLNSSTGKISGTPTAPGTVNFTIQVTDSSEPAQIATKAYSIRIAADLVITNESLPEAQVNHPYSVSLIAQGGTAPLTWSITSGTLPAGITFDSSTGVLSGTPTTTGTVNLTFKVVDSSTPQQSDQVTLALTRVTAPFAITTATLPNGLKNQPYSTTLAASDGVAPYAWSLLGDSALPPGLTLNDTTGEISGTPTLTGTFTFTVHAEDSTSTPKEANKELSIKIVAPLSIATTTLPGSTTNASYSATLSATGGNPPYTWSIQTGTLPTGLTLNGTTGVISGITTVQGSKTFTVKVVDTSAPTPLSTTKQFTIDVQSPLQIITAAVPDAVRTKAYSTTLVGSGGTAPYTWSLQSGTLPAGLSLNPSSGAITGTPTASGSFPLTFKLKDTSSPFQTTTRAMTLVVAEPLVITSTTNNISQCTINAPCSITLTSTGGTAPISWSKPSGSLPPGLTLNPTTGVISGTPTAAGSYTVTVKAVDSANPSQADSKSLTLVVNPT